MWPYTVATDAGRLTWWAAFVKDGEDCRERLRVTRGDISGGRCLRTVPARKPSRSESAARADLEFYAWSRARFGTHAATPLLVSGQDVVLHGSYFHALHHRDPAERRPFRALFVREGGTVELREMYSQHSTYAAVLHVRRWLLLLPLLLAALLLCLCLSFCGNPAESGSPALGFLQGMTQTEGAKSEPVLSVEYASYSSTPDSTLQADRLAQHLTLSLPANCKDGGNPIDSAPSIYIDLNHDGQFEASELVYNPNGDLLKAGTEVSELEFTQAVPAGTYDALTRWDSVLSSDHSQAAGSATFKWVATFQ